MTEENERGKEMIEGESNVESEKVRREKKMNIGYLCICFRSPQVSIQ